MTLLEKITISLNWYYETYQLKLEELEDKYNGESEWSDAEKMEVDYLTILVNEFSTIRKELTNS